MRKIYSKLDGIYLNYIYRPKRYKWPRQDIVPCQCEDKQQCLKESLEVGVELPLRVPRRSGPKAIIDP
jgi:hypothetical protein